MAEEPGTNNTYEGVPDSQDRADNIAYLRNAGTGPECARR
jgi:cytochrome c2